MIHNIGWEAANQASGSRTVGEGRRVDSKGFREPAVHQICDISDQEQFTILCVVGWLLENVSGSAQMVTCHHTGTMNLPQLPAWYIEPRRWPHMGYAPPEEFVEPTLEVLLLGGPKQNLRVRSTRNL